MIAGLARWVLWLSMDATFAWLALPAILSYDISGLWIVVSSYLLVGAALDLHRLRARLPGWGRRSLRGMAIVALTYALIGAAVFGWLERGLELSRPAPPPVEETSRAAYPARQFHAFSPAAQHASHV